MGLHSRFAGQADPHQEPADQRRARHPAPHSIKQGHHTQLLLTQPGTRIFFRPRDNDSALKISRSLGNTTVHQRKVLPSGGIHDDERQKPLLDPSEVERLPKSKIIVLTPTTNPALIDTFHPTEHDEYCATTPPGRRALAIDEKLVRQRQNAGINRQQGGQVIQGKSSKPGDNVDDSEAYTEPKQASRMPEDVTPKVHWDQDMSVENQNENESYSDQANSVSGWENDQIE